MICQTAITPVDGIAPLFDGPFGTATGVTQGAAQRGFLSTADVLSVGSTIIDTSTENNVNRARHGH